ncbi:hypothetical protein NG798_23405 [Ancylothrix sp. C2]|uniref:hypothetical protein n=1 Tax=Ancylothrix sp. D3o TaxID=2953691 RepID=UPI0021BB0C8B|nr:hypothetical protein [Ancylothrix sp. D3o]MCT7952752.1 hypothetical protein [Ancylothrix sp. D3o]
MVVFKECPQLVSCELMTGFHFLECPNQSECLNIAATRNQCTLPFYFLETALIVRNFSQFYHREELIAAGYMWPVTLPFFFDNRNCLIVYFYGHHSDYCEAIQEGWFPALLIPDRYEEHPSYIECDSDDDDDDDDDHYPDYYCDDNDY